MPSLDHVIHVRTSASSSRAQHRQKTDDRKQKTDIPVGAGRDADGSKHLKLLRDAAAEEEEEREHEEDRDRRCQTEGRGTSDHGGISTDHRQQTTDH
jgi:hypothetical protein